MRPPVPPARRLALLSGLALLLACAAPAASQRPAGPAGPAGPAAPAGPSGPSGPSGLSEGSEGAGRETLARLARAVRGGHWIDAWSLLSARWRASATPARLAADYRSAGPVAAESADWVLALLASGAPLVATGPGRLELPVGPGRAARLLVEGGAWRVDSLE